MARPLGQNDSLLHIDKLGEDGLTFREMVQELDESVADLDEYAREFIADLMDYPERFRTPKQESYLRRIWDGGYTLDDGCDR